jgi:RNA polymerase sigma factor (sigma-70 family)
MANSYSTSGGGVDFRTTHWSLVLTACQSDSPQAQEALAKLCQVYWYPVYAFLRRRGHDPDQAKDLTQELFAQLIEKRGFEVADRERGRFRSFLLACLQHVLSHERKKEQALKRGRDYAFISLDEVVAENLYGTEPADVMSPEKMFERRWALTLLDQTVAQLRDEYAQAGKGAQFDALEVFLSGAKNGCTSYAQAGAELHLSDAALRKAVERMRCRFGDLLRMQVAETVANPVELEAELAHLREVLTG